jgi:hypothetical protein
MAINYPAGTMTYLPRIGKQQVITQSTRTNNSTPQSYATFATGSYTKESGTGTPLLVTWTAATSGENNGGGSSRMVIGSNTTYGQFHYGTSNHFHSVIYTFYVTGLGAGTHSWDIDFYAAGWNIYNPNSNDDSRNVNQGPSTIHFMELVNA